MFVCVSIFPFLIPDHQFGPFLYLLLLALVFHVYLQAGSPLDLLQGHLHLKSYRCMAVKWVSPWRWLLEGEKRRFLTVLKQVRTPVTVWGFPLCFPMGSTAVNVVCPRQGILRAIWVLILLEGLLLSDCTSEVVLVYSISSAVLFPSIFLNVETSIYNFQIFFFFIRFHRLGIFPCSLSSAVMLHVYPLKKPNRSLGNPSFFKKKTTNRTTPN